MDSNLKRAADLAELRALIQVAESGTGFVSPFTDEQLESMSTSDLKDLVRKLLELTRTPHT